MNIKKLHTKCTNINIRGEAKGGSGDSAQQVVAIDVKLESVSIAIGALRNFCDLDEVMLTEMQGNGIGRVDLLGNFQHHNVSIKGDGELPEVLLLDAKLNAIVAQLGDHEPGFIGLAFRVQGRPKTRTDTGKLAELVNGDVYVSAEPGKDLFSEEADEAEEATSQ